MGDGRSGVDGQGVKDIKGIKDINKNVSFILIRLTILTVCLWVWGELIVLRTGLGW
jgi:hypothetical protein